MNRRLGDISEIQFGPYEKGRDKGDAKYLLASHFDSQYQPTQFELSYLNLTKDTEKYLLKSSDVILAGKGQRSFAWAYDEKEGPCVPSSLFFVIECDVNVVLGDYLAHYLNTEFMQHKLKLIGAGGTIPSIPKKELERLEVWTPSIDEQKRIVELANLLTEDIALTTELADKKKAMQKTIMNKIFKTQMEKK